MTLTKVRLPSGEIRKIRVPDDWDQNKITEEIHKQFGGKENFSHAIEQESPSQSQPEVSEPKESTGWKGLGSDVVRSLGHALKGGVGLLRRAPGDISEIGSELLHHPLSYPPHVAQQILASLGKGAKGIYNLQHDVLNELGKKELIPDWLKKFNKLPLSHIPDDTGMEKLFGLQPTKKSDELIRALPTIYGLGKGANVTRKAFKSPDLKNVIKETQSKVKQTKDDLSKAFENVESEVKTRGIGPIPVKNSLIKEAERFLDKSPESKKLLKQAGEGDYKSLRELQADLREIGETALSNKLSTERKTGKEALSARKRINESIEDHFEGTGHKDLSGLLKASKEGYADLQNTYFSSPALARVFGKSQKLPKNPLTLLTEDSTEMNRFLSSHPEVQKALKKALKIIKLKKGALGAAKIAGIGTAAELARKVIG